MKNRFDLKTRLRPLPLFFFPFACSLLGSAIGFPPAASFGHENDRPISAGVHSLLSPEVGVQPQETTPPWATVAAELEQVPQTLLSLIHAAEVQDELKLTPGQVNELESFFGEIDGDWWRARNLPLPQRRQTLAALENKLMEKLTTLCSPAALARLRQLEAQAQAVRMLFRPDIASFVGLTPEQVRLLNDLASQTDSISARIADSMQKGESTADAQKELASATTKENAEVFASLNPTQREKLVQVTGPAFETAKLERIYPMAPELIVSDGWVETPAKSLADLRGKVVIVHFYAFQCINCQRNLPRYNEWNQTFRGKDVVIIGIQTPETKAEHDAEKIRAAAQKDQMNYPVLLDLQSLNWKEWSNTMWPTVYVIDRRGYIRFWWQGELNWQGAKGDKTVADLVQRLLKEK